MASYEKNRSKFKVSKLILYIILIIMAVVYLYPLIWLVIASFKTNTEVFLSPFSFPAEMQWVNYEKAWNAGHIGQYFVNSVIVVGTVLVVSILINCMAAYAIARMRWKLSGLVMGVFLSGMMVPIHVTLIPLFVLFSNIGLIDNYFSLILPYIVFTFGQSIYIMRGFFGNLPKEMEEAAVIDGCSLWGAFWRIILPISTGGIFTIGLFTFNGTWNELLVAKIFTNSNAVRTLPVGLTVFVGPNLTNYGPMLAAIVIAVLPTIIVYCCLSNKIVGGLTAGAVKG
ncbi:MAG: carbohydrate ABC transporter permease [Oscillospiraceae bacterium]|nr:carbohydrate ABC transporter permease [Oscillospiraceae bacterium]